LASASQAISNAPRGKGQPYRDFVKAETLAAGGCDAEIAGQRDDYAAGGRVAVDHRDRELGQRPQQEQTVILRTSQIADAIASGGGLL
jgi:hypothetical protein